MVDQVVPITDIASAGVIKDIPSISLPPNAYSDVQNIRFHDGAAWKMEGELAIPALDDSNIVYAAYWKAPGIDYYVVVIDDSATAEVKIYDVSTGTLMSTKNMAAPAGAVWQHTLFNGGFNFILNNGVSTPGYLTAPETQDGDIAPLPNWDSYQSQEEVTTVTWDEFNADIMLGRKVNFATESILYTVIPRDTSVGVFNYIQETDSDITPYTLDTTTDTDQDILTPQARSEGVDGALPGDQITISIRTDATITVTAGVIRAYGNLLIAGDLEEKDGTNVIRSIPGTIRTSDVAAPGAIPFNWNPFRNGANTADEFILSSTGRVQDMAELQGVMYVYTDVSIHAIQQTGNEVIPFQISTTTDSYGCNSLGAVMEFDGRHLVVGSQDIYVFAGHPGSISSVGDKRVRHYAYEQTDPTGIDTDNIRMVRNQKYDEIWIFNPDAARNEMLVWNYRSQAWTIRRQSGVNSGTKGKDGPLFTNNTQVFLGDAPTVYTMVDGITSYESYVQRMRLGLTPEFDTETLGSTAVMYTSEANVELDILMRGTNQPGDESGIMGSERYRFEGQTDYKVDTRVHGRFINYKITDDLDDGMAHNKQWNLTGYQLEIMKGGKR